MSKINYAFQWHEVTNRIDWRKRRTKMSKVITGMIAIGNGEKCPHCDSIMVNNAINGLSVIDHMKGQHFDEFISKLFPEKDNAHAEGSSPDDEMVKSEDIEKQPPNCS